MFASNSIILCCDVKMRSELLGHSSFVGTMNIQVHHQIKSQGCSASLTLYMLYHACLADAIAIRHLRYILKY